MDKFKLVVIINGRGGVGKDTFCNVISDCYNVLNVSSIDPVKEIARTVGWQNGKEFKDRKFLSDMKSLLVEYNDYPTQYLLSEYKRFMEDDIYQVMFVHIREPKEIEKFRALIDGRCITLKITRSDIENVVFGNSSDDNVDDYDYDYTYHNDTPLESVSLEMLKYFNTILDSEKLKEFPHR